MKIKTILLSCLIMLSLSGCSRKKVMESDAETVLNIYNSTGLKVTSFKSKGPMKIGISGATVDITMIKEEPELTKEIKKSKK